MRLVIAAYPGTSSGPAVGIERDGIVRILRCCRQSLYWNVELDFDVTSNGMLILSMARSGLKQHGPGMQAEEDESGASLNSLSGVYYLRVLRHE